MSDAFEYVFPAIRGVQARREYFVSMCPLRLIPKIFLFNEDELLPELRAQRVLNRARVPELARYMVDNRDDYVFSALTASIGEKVRFVPAGGANDEARIGMLHVPMTAQFVINDGQHRRAAIEAALKDRPDLADESIAVVFFLDVGLSRSQQMFADLNRHAVRPSRSIGILYDHRDLVAQLTRKVVTRSPVFRDVVEMERTTLAIRSRKLFTLSAIYLATEELLTGQEGSDIDVMTEVATTYWEEVARHFPEWHRVREGRMTAGEVRTDFIHSHGIVLHALGRVGYALMHDPDQNAAVSGAAVESGSGAVFAEGQMGEAIGGGGNGAARSSRRGRPPKHSIAAAPTTAAVPGRRLRGIEPKDALTSSSSSRAPLAFSGDRWRTTLGRLRSIDWARNNAALWEGRAMAGGKISKSHQHLALTTSAIKQHLGLSLTPEEQRLEDAFRRGDQSRDRSDLLE